MKGIIFTEFLAMVEEAHGLALKDQIIRAARLPNDGAYTAVGNYDFHELTSLVGRLSEVTGTPVPQLLVAFGNRIFQYFAENYGHFFASAKSSFEFLGHIEDYIHVEVRKLYPDAELPTFRYPSQDSRRLVMEYHSVRPLGLFAEGLIQATIRHYGEDVDLQVEDLSGGAGTAMRFSLTRRG
jgi:hypothetical protein